MEKQKREKTQSERAMSMSEQKQNHTQRTAERARGGPMSGK